MLISELIVELQNIKNEIGNIPVVYFETEIGEFYEPIVSVQNIKTVFDGEGDQESFKEAGITGDFVLLNGED